MKRRSMTRVIAMLLAMVLMAGLVTGCGSTNPPETTKGGSTPVATDPGASGPAGTEEVDSKRGGIIRFGGSNMGEFFSPYKQGTLTNYGWPCYEPLAYYKVGQVWEPVLAESWEVDAEACTLTVKIRQGITFHNGDTLDADDVVFSHAARNDYGTQTTIGSPTKIEALDPYTVQFTWEEFNLNFEYWILTQYIYSKDTFEEKGLDWMLNNMVGTGPYKMKEFIPDVKLTFERADSYWQEETPAPDGFEWLYMADTTTSTAAFISGELDYMNNVSQAPVLAQLETEGFEGVEGTFSSAMQQIAIPISVDPDSPLAKKEVRQAIYLYGIDWDTMATTIAGARGYHTDALGFSGMPYYDESIEKNEYNPEKAKQMLADAGYPNGFEITIYAPSNNAMDAAFIQAMLKDIGITAEVETVDYGVIQGEYMSGKAVQSGIAIWGLKWFSVPQLDRFTKHLNPYATVGGSSSWSDEMLSLWAKVGAATSLDEQSAALLEYVKQFVTEDCNIWPMYNNIGGLIFTNEWMHYTDQAEASGSGYDPFEFWTDKR